MKGMKLYVINDERQIHPCYEKGDRVATYAERDGVTATGTVQTVTHGGLFVYVQWDKEKHRVRDGYIQLSSKRLVDGLKWLDAPLDEPSI